MQDLIGKDEGGSIWTITFCMQLVLSTLQIPSYILFHLIIIKTLRSHSDYYFILQMRLSWEMTKVEFKLLREGVGLQCQDLTSHANTLIWVISWFICRYETRIWARALCWTLLSSSLSYLITKSCLLLPSQYVSKFISSPFPCHSPSLKLL